MTTTEHPTPTKENPDIAYWQGKALIHISYNEYRDGDPVREEVYMLCDPTGEDFCYWCAIGGRCFALAPLQPSCIAGVESALKAQTAIRPATKDALSYDACYVIWQPKDHTFAAWERWEKKWSKRTA